MGKRAGVGLVHPHMLRAGFIIAALDAGVPLVRSRSPLDMPTPAPPRCMTAAAKTWTATPPTSSWPLSPAADPDAPWTQAQPSYRNLTYPNSSLDGPSLGGARPERTATISTPGQAKTSRKGPPFEAGHAAAWYLKRPGLLVRHLFGMSSGAPASAHSGAPPGDRGGGPDRCCSGGRSQPSSWWSLLGCVYGRRRRDAQWADSSRGPSIRGKRIPCRVLPGRGTGRHCLGWRRCG